MNIKSFDQLANMRGALALTQGVKNIEQLLVDNVNETGAKILGFVKTRQEVMERTERKTVEDWVDFCSEVSNKEAEDTMVKMGARFMVEKIFRDHVTTVFINDFRKNTKFKLRLLGRDGAVSNILKYVTSGLVVPITQTHKEIKEENEKKEVIYYAPRVY